MQLSLVSKSPYFATKLTKFHRLVSFFIWISAKNRLVLFYADDLFAMLALSLLFMIQESLKLFERSGVFRIQAIFLSVAAVNRVFIR